MQLSDHQLDQIAIAGRAASALSLLGVVTIIATFAYSSNFRSPTHRIMLINAFYNVFDFIATMISVSGPAAGDESGLCRFQAFSLQMFPVADVLWTLAMTWDVVLVVFWQYEPEALRKLEKKYVAVITTITITPALIFLFVRSDAKGPLYGSVVFWCAISPNWVKYRIVFYYAPIMLLIAIVLVLYIVIGCQIIKLGHEFILTQDDRLRLSSSADASNESLYQANHSHNHNNLHTKPSTNTLHRSDAEAAIDITITDSPDPNPIMHHHSAVPLRKFILMPMVFFIALLTTWITPTVNRIYSFRHPGQERYALMVAVAALGSLRGFWNGLIFVTMRSKGRG
ncbi:hypothetical protein BDW74DRAFT_169765 [Aspergillus multicolor]|uniref:putative cAMP receptor (Car4) n=1 Tax=Aspergillus multicolor TaxID=41759 RepID=UPI003CCD93AF